MPVEKNISNIIARLQQKRAALERTLALTNPEDLLLPGVVVRWSGKDVLAHLAEWEVRMVRWVERSRAGETVNTPDDDLTWKQNNLNNQRIYEKYASTPLEDVLAFFHAAHRQLMQMVDSLTDEELLKPGYFSFTGSAAVYDWLNAYANHDGWGNTKLRAWLRAQGKITTQRGRSSYATR